MSKTNLPNNKQPSTTDIKKSETKPTDTKPVDSKPVDTKTDPKKSEDKTKAGTNDPKTLVTEPKAGDKKGTDPKDASR